MQASDRLAPGRKIARPRLAHPCPAAAYPVGIKIATVELCTVPMPEGRTSACGRGNAGRLVGLQTMSLWSQRPNEEHNAVNLSQVIRIAFVHDSDLGLHPVAQSLTRSRHEPASI